MQVLIGLAIFVLAVNLAYVRFETFDHRERIKQYALEKLGRDKAPSALKEEKYYKRLSAWAGESNDEDARKSIAKQLGWSGQLRQLLFDRNHDRQIAETMVVIAVATVIAGTTHASGVFEIPNEDAWSGWLWVLLECMTAICVGLVLTGNRYISKAISLIDGDTEKRDTFMSGRASSARTSATMSRSARTGRTGIVLHSTGVAPSNLPRHSGNVPGGRSSRDSPKENS